jgi:hypothetical protein
MLMFELSPLARDGRENYRSQNFGGSIPNDLKLLMLENW